VALAPGEVSADPARTWVRKEAVLKAAGTGLSVDPREVDVTHDALGSPWPGVVVDVPVADFACAAAVLGVQHVEVLVREAGRSPAVRRPVGRTAS
jgi:phosphopantetheinyl transferase (holo-ACP synthase)